MKEIEGKDLISSMGYLIFIFFNTNPFKKWNDQALYGREKAGLFLV